MQTRPYQAEALDGIRTQLEDNPSTLLVMATGTGKTVVFAHAAKEYMKWGRVMILAHRGELIYQAVNQLTTITGTEPDIEMADYHATRGSNRSQIVCSTIQSQIAGMNGDGRMTKFNPNEFSLIIWDEAHHCAADSYKRVKGWYSQNTQIKHLGVTATPDRADEKALGQMFETVAYEYGILEAINDGFLVPIQQQAVYVDGLDFSGCRTTAGDLNGKDLATIMEQENVLHEIAAPTFELTQDRKTLVFTASLAHAERLTEILNRHRADSAKWVHGGTPKDERAVMFREYAEGRFQYLVNVGVATEGFDDPGIEVVVMARPTKSRSLYAQMCGRGTRTLPGTIDGIQDATARRSAIALSGKPVLDVLDFVGNSGRHRLITTADILGGDYNDDVVERAKKKIAESGEACSVLDELEAAQKELEAEAVSANEKLRRERIIARAKYSTAKVNPFNVLDLEPVREKGWHQGRGPTDGQLACLEKMGVDTAGLSFTHASQLIGTVIKNREKGICTYKQAKTLAKFNYDPKDITFKQAHDLIDAIAANGWRRPA
jgi:superfamily II DNA or RNA helicase